ncbi:MAG: hypothetical protein AB8F74_18840 [Saprospiraceae bacterium]
MKVIKAYILGWKTLLQLKKMWLGLYAIQAFTAMLAVIPVSRYLGKTVGHSLDLPNSLGRFDYTFFTDFLHEYGDGFTALVSQSFGYVFIYFLVMIFLMGGILTKIKSRQTKISGKNFFQGGGHFFWRLFRLSFYFLLLHAILFGLFTFLFLQQTNYVSLFELENELVIINTLVYLLPAYLILASILFMIHDITKIELTQRDDRWLTGIIKSSLQKSVRHFFSYYPFYLLNILSFVILTAIYIFVHGKIAPTTLEQVILIFLLGQLYVFLKIGLKIVGLGGLVSLND